MSKNRIDSVGAAKVCGIRWNPIDEESIVFSDVDGFVHMVKKIHEKTKKKVFKFCLCLFR